MEDEIKLKYRFILEKLFKVIFLKRNYIKLVIFNQKKEDIEDIKEDNIITKENQIKDLPKKLEEKYDEKLKIN